MWFTSSTGENGGEAGGETGAEVKLKNGLADIWVKVNARYLEQLLSAFERWEKNDSEGENFLASSLTEFMLYQVNQTADHIIQLKQKLSEFNRRYLRSADNEERQQHILGFSAVLGATKRNLAQDKKAFTRWFDRDAILDRFDSQLFAEQQRLSFYLERLGWVYADSISQNDNTDKFWYRHDLEATVRPLFAFEGDNRVRVAAFHCLARALYALPYEKHEQLVSDATMQYIYRASLEKSQDILIQREALSLLGVLSVKSLQVVLSKRLTEPTDGDDFFVRRHAVALVGQYQEKMPELKILLFVAAEDGNAAVRQNVAPVLVDTTAAFIVPVLSKLVLHDADVAVRASSLLCVLDFLKRNEYFDDMLQLLLRCFSSEQDKFALKVLLKIAVDGLPLINSGHQQRQQWIETLLPEIIELHTSSHNLEIRRIAAQVREWFWLYGAEQNQNLYHDLSTVLHNLKEGRAIKLASDVQYDNELQLARVLSLLAITDHGFSVELGRRGRFIRKGDQFKFRFWRFLHELRNASTDKRQGHRHTTGRHFYGTLRAPSHIMCELAETKVPGEPLMIPEEGGWRPYLPLVDDMLSALDQGWPTKPYQLVTSEGVTEILPPASLWHRLKAQASLSVGFEHFARQRNWLNASQGDASAYINALKQLGFDIRYRPHDYAHTHAVNEDSKVKRFFAAAIPFDLAATSDQIKDYFFSVYENTLLHLGVFVVLVSSYFFGRHIVLNTQMRKARNAIPLVIGGWGTRGKSGTERLKAALFNALGYSVVSKTSGCEAMFLHAPAYGHLREMFLFRPYDKATIWEQMDVVKLSARLDCDVFLWECMGLTPSYVKVLQKDWMRDDIATITNTYPDHEDLQGPGGHEIPRVMTNFIPENSTLITTEEQMLPILRESAAGFNTKLRSVGWLEAGLLTDDILQRFPYEEHPYNIALVLEMAAELGIEKDFALKEMADRVVADLGVLKTYPLASLHGRKLEFVMGMSANERFGAMSNWARMGFDQHSLDHDPQVWVTTVVNNRADRVPRSRVFADMIATELSVDRHILIGNNLQGLKGYIEEAWQDNLHRINLFSDDSKESAVQRFQKMAQHFRVPVNDSQLDARVKSMLAGLEIAGLNLNDTGLKNCWRATDDLQKVLDNKAQNSNLSFEPDELLTAINAIVELHEDYQRFLQRLENETDQKKLQSDFNRLAWSWLEQKLIIVDDYYASGNHVIHTITQHTPPGLKARIMGMQNIKGTGLDYVYCWQAWETCYLACDKMLSEDELTARQGVKSLEQFKEYAPMCQDTVTRTIEQVKNRNWAQREDIQAELVMIQSNMSRALSRISQDEQNTRATTGWVAKVTELFEAFFDAGDAVKRRKRANRIYEDLQNKRISHDRAAMELQAINKRQKGGWAGEYFTHLGKSR